MFLLGVTQYALNTLVSAVIRGEIDAPENSPVCVPSNMEANHNLELPRPNSTRNATGMISNAGSISSTIS
jgi:hypothetical protein